MGTLESRIKKTGRLLENEKKKIPHFLADQKAPPGSGGAPHYYRPPGFLTLAASLLNIQAENHDLLLGFLVRFYYQNCP